jgi:toxin ParE1/3/4
MKNKVQRTPRARADLLEIHNYIDDDNPRAADRFLDAAEECFKLLARMPGVGRRWLPIRQALAHVTDIRVYSIPRFRTYQVFYRPIDKGLLVIRVLHGARDLERVLGKETGT